MRILYVITRSDEVGGAHIHVRDLAVWMAARGHEVHVAVGGSGFYLEMLRAAGVAVTTISSLRRSVAPLADLRAVVELRRVIAVLRPDLVSAHSAKAGVVARIAARTQGVPCVFTAHGWAFAEGIGRASRWLALWTERLLAPFAAAIITVCEADLMLARRRRVGSGTRMVAIHNGMPDAPRSTGVLAAEPRLVMVARFEPQKDHHTLVAALASLGHLPWRLILVGDGPGRADCVRAVEGAGLSERVEFVGRRSDVALILGGAALFVLTSFWEGFPRSILEAMRAGLPVIATDVGGVAEAVDDGKSGFVVPVGETIVLADRLRRLLASPQLRAAMGAVGRERYEARFTFERMAQATESLYREVQPA